MTEAAKRTVIWTMTWMAYGHGPEEKDYVYWLGKWDEMAARGVEIGVPDYAERRMRGWEAENGPDAAKFGEFAVPPTLDHSVPPSPWLEDAPRPVVDAPPAVDLSAVLARIDRLQQELTAEIVSVRLQATANTDAIQTQINSVVKDAEKTLKDLAAANAGGGLLKMLGFGK